LFITSDAPLKGIRPLFVYCKREKGCLSCKATNQQAAPPTSALPLPSPIRCWSLPISFWLDTVATGKSLENRGKNLLPGDVTEWGERRTEAIRGMGINALPFLVRWIGYESRPWRKKLSGMLAGTRLWPLVRDRGEDRAGLVITAFAALGDQSGPALPELTQLMKGTNFRPAFLALNAVDASGAVGVPVLLDVLTNRGAYNGQRGFSVLGTMSHLGTNAYVAVPTLVDCLTNANPQVAGTAAVLLGAIGVEQDVDKEMRCRALFALGRFGERARPELPSLLQAMRDDDGSVREAATNAVKVVAPEVMRQNSF
jgi:hypothetical protein